MKEITKTSRLAGQLEKLFNMLNAEFFNNELDTPVITIQSTPRAYGHYTMYDAWSVKGEGHKEINIGAGTLNRPIENICSTLIHEMVHMYNDTVAKVQDCSRVGTYHNKLFKREAEARGLICTHTDKYGWSDTSSVISDTLLEWILNNNVNEIKLNRNDPFGVRIAGGNTSASGGLTPIGTRQNHNHRYVCPCCGCIARSGKPVNLICGDCMEAMIED